MGTYDFVKTTGRDKYWELMEREKRSVVDPRTGELRRELSRYANCPVCEKSETKPVFMKDGFRYVKCIGCGIVFINPQFDETRLLARYRSLPSQNYWVEVLQTGPQMQYDTKKFRNALQDIEKFVTPGRILDIGCSIGLFLKLARERGWETYGVELNRKARSAAVKLHGLDVYGKPLDELNFENNFFDIITLWEVLEHLQEPRKILIQAHRILRKGGVLVILVPNLDSLAVRIMWERAATFGWGHLWYFTPAALTKMLHSLGYKVFQDSTELGEIDTISNYLQFDDPYIKGKESAIASPYRLSKRLKKDFAEWVVRNNMGYKLRVYARKK